MIEDLFEAMAKSSNDDELKEFYVKWRLIKENLRRCEKNLWKKFLELHKESSRDERFSRVSSGPSHGHKG